MRNISLIQQMLHFADQDWADSSLHFNVEGSLIRPGEHVQPVPRAGQFLQEECHWVISPPPHRMLRLTVDTSNIRNGECEKKKQQFWKQTVFGWFFKLPVRLTCVFQWAVLAGSSVCGLRTSRPGPGTAWTGCAGRTRGGSTPSPRCTASWSTSPSTASTPVTTTTPYTGRPRDCFSPTLSTTRWGLESFFSNEIFLSFSFSQVLESAESCQFVKRKVERQKVFCDKLIIPSCFRRETGDRPQTGRLRWPTLWLASPWRPPGCLSCSRLSRPH